MDMTEIIADFGSLHFWVSVVFVGIFASIFGNFLTKFLDSRVQKFKSWRDQRAKNNDENYQTDLQNLFRSPALVTSLRDREARKRLTGIALSINSWGLSFVGLILAGFFNIPKWILVIIFISAALGFIVETANSSLANRADRLLTDYYSALAREEKEGLLPKGK